ncbi:MAG: hypothetical protein KatS3mg032_2419 [Cyclobacteriaceae bacterium]|nr:MAG: hypothetical protein KatS3mg032_2419 [Cyclobacteriaceae bacterium]
MIYDSLIMSKAVRSIMGFDFVFCAALLLQCTTGKRDQIERNFERYMLNVFNKSCKTHTTKVNYYVINTNECEECVDAHFRAIGFHQFDKSTVIIIVGKIYKTEWVETIDMVAKKGVVVLKDEKGEGMRYNFGLMKPILLKFENGKLKDFIKIEDKEILSIITRL